MKKVNFVTKNSLNGGQTGPRMTITEDGKIGIGTETPSKVLDVSGDINFTGTLYQNGSAFSSGGGGGGGSSISSISELTDVNLAGITTNQGVKWDGSKLVPTTLSSGGGGSGVSNGSDVSFNNMDISAVLKGTSGYGGNQLSLGSHIIPTQNAQYDLGNAEYKIRHLFLSDNSLWLGDDHKLDIGDGKMKFKKRDKSKVPKGIKTAYGEDDAAVKTKLVALWNATPELKDQGYGDSGTGDIDANAFGNFKLHDWEKLAHHLQTQTGGNFPANPYNPGEIDAIMGMDDPDYFEEEIGGGPKYHYMVINGGASDYKYSGPGLLGNESNPTMTFYKGSTYILKVNAPGHPFWIKTADSTGTSNAVSADWVKNNGVAVGEIVFTVPMNAPAQYHYNCELHAAMHGVINIA